MITVFTPTYNRSYRLPQLYESLRRQTVKTFEWLVVDDGSTDDTEEKLKNWIREETGFPIRYYKKENGGKHTAINWGVTLAKSDWFFIVDSDDYLTDDAIEKAETWIAKISDVSIAGVSGVSIFPDGKIIGDDIIISVDEFVDARNIDRDKYGLGGDKAEIYRTDILKKLPFPVFEGERFLSEICVWNEIAKYGYLVRWYNYPLKVCEYLDDGLSYQNHNNELMKNNFQGYLYCMRYYLMSSKGLEKLRKTYRFSVDAKQMGCSMATLSEKTDLPIVYIIVADILGNIKNAIKRH